MTAFASSRTALALQPVVLLGVVSFGLDGFIRPSTRGRIQIDASHDPPREFDQRGRGVPLHGAITAPNVGTGRSSEEAVRRDFLPCFLGLLDVLLEPLLRDGSDLLPAARCCRFRLRVLQRCAIWRKIGNVADLSSPWAWESFEVCKNLPGFPLSAWIEARGSEPGALFGNFDRARKGARLSGTSLYRLVRELGLRVGVRARPHGLRHAAITEALDLTSGDVRAVQRFSRHKDVRTLSLYDDSREDLAGKVASLVAGGVA